MITVVRPFQITQLQPHSKHKTPITRGAYYPVLAISDDDNGNEWLIRGDEGKPFWFDPDLYDFEIVDEWSR